jgi:ATP-dependent Lhr-like helicase
MTGLVDFARVRKRLLRAEDKIENQCLRHLSPLSAPLFLEAGRVPVEGQAIDRLIAQEAEALMKEAGLQL